MKTLNLAQMEVVGGRGFWADMACSSFMGGWGVVLAYGVATLAAPATVGLSVGVAAGWTAVSVGLCGAVSYGGSER